MLRNRGIYPIPVKAAYWPPFSVVRHILASTALVGLFLGWNAPNHYPPWAAFQLELFAAVGVVLAAAALLASPRRNAVASAVLPLPPLAYAWIAVAVLPLLQWASGRLLFRADAALGMLYVSGVAAAIYVGQLWSARAGRYVALRALWCTVLGAGLAACGLALVQWLRLDPPGWWAMELIDHRPFANLAQPNHLGLLMVWALIASVALFEQGLVVHRGVLALVAAMCLLGVLISESRAAILALGVVAALCLLRLPAAWGRLRRRDVAVAVLLFTAAYWVHARWQASVGSVDSAHGLTDIGAREAIWRHFIVAIVDRPWLGWGFNQGVLALSSVADQVQPSRNTVYAHNVVLDLMVWFGIPAALVLCTGFAWMLRLLLKPPTDAALAPPRALVAAAWLALLSQSLFEFPYAYAYFLLPLALLTGAVLDLPASGPVHWRIARPGAVLFAGTLAGVVLISAEYLRIEEDFRHARFVRAGFIGQPPRDYLERPLLLDHLALLNASAHFSIAAGMPPAQLQQLRLLARRFNIPSARLDYARALALNGRLDDAEAELRVMRALNPASRFHEIDAQWRAWLREHGLPANLPPR